MYHPLSGTCGELYNKQGIKVGDISRHTGRHGEFWVVSGSGIPGGKKYCRTHDEALKYAHRYYGERKTKK